MLRIGLTIQEFFDSTSDIQEARHQAENFVNSRMRRLFPDMSPDENAEIRERSAEIIDKIEQQVLDDPRAEETEKRPRVSDVNKPKQQAPDSGEIELTDQEKSLESKWVGSKFALQAICLRSPVKSCHTQTIRVNS